MSRFKSLEFEDTRGHSTVQKTAVKDESFFLAEAETAFAQARFDDALRAYARVLEYNPGNIFAWIGQPRMLIELGEFSGANMWADKALERWPDEPELLAVKSVALARMGDREGAITYSDASVEARGKTPYIWLARGDVLLARQGEHAEHCFDKAISSAGPNATIPWLISRIYYFYKQFCLSLKYAQRSISIDSARAAVWLQAGLCQTEMGLTGDAKNSFRQASQLAPNCPKTLAALEQLSNLTFWSRFCRRLLRR